MKKLDSKFAILYYLFGLIIMRIIDKLVKKHSFNK